MNINSRHFKENWFDKIVNQTLDIYNSKGDVSNSPLIIYGKDCIKNKTGHKDYLTDDSPYKRQEALFALYESIKKDGYNGSEILVWFDDDGQVHLYDGFHRLAVIKYLNIEVNLPATTSWHGIGNKTGRDFPLVPTLLKEHPAGKYLYQPVKDDRLKDWKVDRADSPKRLEYILSKLSGRTVLDIGCSEGYFSSELATKYDVTGIDKSKGKIAAARYLNTANGYPPVEFINGKWQELNAHYDNILILSVLHNDMKYQDVEKSIGELSSLKCDNLFLEVPNNTNERDWSKDKYDFHSEESIKKLEHTLKATLIDEYKGLRSIYQFSNWSKHQKFESNWWGTCANTFDEQLKQDIYAKYMKLDKLSTPRKGFDLKGKSVVDIGGGPVSLLLRCINVKGTVVDPCDYPEWVYGRYKASNIEVIKQKAEDVELEGDEAWIYNCLQHVEDVSKVVKSARKFPKVRVFEFLEWEKQIGHPNILTKELLDSLFERQGLTEQHPTLGKIYYGVFNYV